MSSCSLRARGARVMGFSCAVAASLFNTHNALADGVSLLGLGDLPGGSLLRRRSTRASVNHRACADGCSCQISGAQLVHAGREHSAAPKRLRFARCALGASLAGAVCAAVTNPSNALADIVGLGDLPGGAIESYATGVSADGKVVIGHSSSTLASIGMEAFRWTSTGGMVGLGDLPGGTTSSRANGLSSNGSMVVGRSPSTTMSPEAWRWTNTSGMVGLGTLSGYFNSHAEGVSSDGSYVVGWGTTTFPGAMAMRWDSLGAVQGLGDLPGGSTTSRAFGISADGSAVAGYSTSANGTEAFRWTESGGMQALGDLPGGTFESFGLAISADGAVVIGRSNSSNGAQEAFRWTSATGMVGLGDLSGGSFRSVASAMSADGSVIVGEGEGPNGTEAFIWNSQDGMRSLRAVLAGHGIDVSDWNLVRATGISADGSVIVGQGNNKNGFAEAFMVVIPEPASFSLLALGAIALLRRRS